MKLPLTVTSEALEATRQIIASKQIPEKYGLRIGIRGKGCAGSQQFLLGFDTATEQDHKYTLEGLPVYIDKAHLMYVIGLELAYETDDEGNQGFTFNNPKG
ncbi:iron-sulfur cluster assembly accessory protein [uncultured Microscilla sp.]|uniref:HesB/IscA family protein n=1 Tax=uncultured Microscilla sp. TaxID=432653 RepID=UPI0026182F47|nr:iron-sulfur cluster assembly accessory protein [uncultured Microscilla sp.]